MIIKTRQNQEYC